MTIVAYIMGHSSQHNGRSMMPGLPDINESVLCERESTENPPR